MKKVVPVFIAVSFYTTSLYSQVTVKKDVLTYYTSLPAVPASLQDAYQKCTCKSGGCSADSLVAPIKRSMDADSKAMGTLTETEKQEVQSGTQLANKLQADNVNKMNDDQKLQYVQNNQQLNGGNANAVAFAQKMKDNPDEKARLQSMTDAQKIAYLQQNGMLQVPAQANAQMPRPDSGKATDAMRQQKKMQAMESNAQKAQLVQTMNDQLDASKLNAAHAQIDQQEQAELSAANANSAAAKAIRNKYTQQHLTLAQNQLQGMQKAYQDLYNYLTTDETPFCNSLTAINYGYTGDPNQDNEVSSLAIGQSIVLGNVGNLCTYLKSIYEFGAKWQLTSMQ